MEAKIVDVVIPAWNEQQSVGLVIKDIPHALVRHIVVCDNNSTDLTAQVAREAGAIVLRETEQGYGAACLRGLDFLRQQVPRPEIVVFLDADYSDHPEEMSMLLEPIRSGAAEMVIGARVPQFRERGSMMPQQIFGNYLATSMMRVLFGGRFTDLGPFRAITWSALEQLEMKDRNFGWTVEMQVKALKKNIKWAEVPVHYRCRKGVSKVSGTIKGSLSAGYKIIYTILRYA